MILFNSLCANLSLTAIFFSVGNSRAISSVVAVFLAFTF